LFVEGKKVVRDGHIVTINMRKTAERQRILAQRLMD